MPSFITGVRRLARDCAVFSGPVSSIRLKNSSWPGARVSFAGRCLPQAFQNSWAPIWSMLSMADKSQLTLASSLSGLSWALMALIALSCASACTCQVPLAVTTLPCWESAWASFSWGDCRVGITPV